MESLYFRLDKLLTDIGPVFTSDEKLVEEIQGSDGTSVVRIGGARIFDFNRNEDVTALTNKYPNYIPLTGESECKTPSLNDQSNYEQIRDCVISLGYDGFWADSPYGKVFISFYMSNLESVHDYQMNDHTTVQTVLSFDQLIKYIQENGRECPLAYFNFYRVSDDEINSYLDSENNLDVDVTKGWNHGKERMVSSELPKNTHVMRIAKLVKEIEKNGFNNPIEFRIHPYMTDLQIVDGHHRIRALCYLNIEKFPATVSGSKTVIERLLGMGT